MLRAPPLTGYVASPGSSSAAVSASVESVGASIATPWVSTTSTVRPASTSITDGKEFEAGLSTGVGRAIDRLAQYYIALAEKTFPVIEVDAGRTVDVVLTQGVAIEAPTDSTDADADTTADGDPGDPAYPVSADPLGTPHRTVGGDDDE